MPEFTESLEELYAILWSAGMQILRVFADQLGLEVKLNAMQNDLT